ncbi:MAG: hypothetical protein Q9162_000791 [Coniocarpon cinnabarinum]
MEPTAAIALAGSILHFIHVGFVILSKANDLKRAHDGRLEEHTELDLVISDLDARLQALYSEGNDGLIVLVTKCQEVGSELRDALLRVQRKGRGGLWSSYRQALSIVWNKNTLDEVERRLESVRDELNFHLQTDIRHFTPVNSYRRASGANHAVRDELSKVLRHTISSENSVEELKNQVRTAFDALTSPITHEHTPEGQLVIETRKLRENHDRLLDLLQTYMQYQSSTASEKPKPKACEFFEASEFRSMRERRATFAEAHAQIYQWLLMDPAAGYRSREQWWSYDQERRQLKTNILDTLQGIGVDADTSGDPLGFKTTIAAQVSICSTGSQWRIVSSGYWASQAVVLKQSRVKLDLIFSVKEQKQAIIRSNKSNSEDNVWSIHELGRAFRTWRCLNDSKLYLHVDGIDETHSTYAEITHILTDITAYPNVKVLAAGRWTPEFHEAFHRTLALHETTKLDILHYVVDKLNGP